MMEADVVIVGGGSAGAVMASRLSELPTLKVVLVEAGRDTPPGAVPADIRDTFPSSYANPGYFWPGQTAAMRTGEPQRPFLQPRVMGGGSSVMGMLALPGLAADYDRWETMGAHGWGWRNVAPAFGALVNDADIGHRNANATPPYPVQRLPRENWPLYIQRIEEAAGEHGLATVPDIFATQRDAFFALPLSHDHERASSARCYLDEGVRARPNLRIVANGHVAVLLLDGARVRGVVIDRGDQHETIHAREVVVSAGAVNSPALLLRSGIGPANELARAGVTPVVDRPGVGRNYQNHSQLHFALTLKENSRLSEAQRNYAMTGIRFSSHVEGCPPGDLFIYQTGRVSSRTFGTRMALVAAALYSPRSRGVVTLRSPHSADAPNVEQRLLSDPRDAQRMVIAARFAERLICTPRVSECFHEAYLLPREAPLRLVNGTGAIGALKAIGATAVLRAPSLLRRTVLERAIKPGRLVCDAAGTRPLQDHEIIAASGTMFHPSGTCRMGAADDVQAVVDPECRVHGIAGLRVIDASVMPCLPSANTNLPTLMIAERAAEMMQRRLR